MERGVADIVLSDEEEELVFNRDDVIATEEDYSLCLVGVLLTNKQYNFPAFQSRMASLWQPGRRVAIEELGNKLVLFRFNHIVDLRRVMELGPWSFDSSLLVLKEVQPGETPYTVDLTRVDFWVQVCDLPATMYTEKVGTALGNFVGRFVEYDESNLVPFDREYMRLRVSLDISKPLKREKKVRVEGGKCITCTFRYERLPNFCYICGKIGHIDRYCEVLFQVPEEEIVRVWDERLRAPPRRARRLAGEEWLERRDERREGSSRGVQPVRRGGSGGWKEDKEATPRNVVTLMRNLGASAHTEGITVAFGREALSGEDDPINVREERKRRRPGGGVVLMDEEPYGGSKPTKSPKKSVQNPKSGKHAGCGDAACQSS
ncbi:Uncharacterized protein At4g02000 [Linum perenne]